ncbi:MAG: hypothetical protein ACK4TP_12815 [Hyphomicrobium sp.]
MFSIFERTTSDLFETVTYDLDEPIPSAIAVTSDFIERKLDISRGWVREARAALQTGDLQKHNGFLRLAKSAAEEAAVLIESADLLFDDICDWQ